MSDEIKPASPGPAPAVRPAGPKAVGEAAAHAVEAKAELYKDGDKPAAHVPATDPAAPTLDAAGAADPATMKAAMALVMQMMGKAQVAATLPTGRRDGADTAPEGGHFVVDGRHVTAWGESFAEGEDGTLGNHEFPRNRR